MLDLISFVNGKMTGSMASENSLIIISAKRVGKQFCTSYSRAPPHILTFSEKKTNFLRTTFFVASSN